MFVTLTSCDLAQEEAIAAKASFLAKLGRERRNLDRQRKQYMSREEITRNRELEKLKEVSVSLLLTSLDFEIRLSNIRLKRWS